MITRAGVEKLGAVHAVEPTVLSLYLSVPPYPAEPRRLTARANELIAAVDDNADRSRHLGEDDQSSAIETVATAGRNWPGRTVAIFTCADAGLNEAIPLPCGLPERAVLRTRPHIRPLLLVLQGEQRAQHLAREILATPPGEMAAVGQAACLAAVDSCAVETLVVPADGLVRGYECGRCGPLSTADDSCPDWGTAPLQVPDVIEEMVSRTLEDGGQEQ